jgi:CheY-like chemotaxis protein
MMQGDTGGPPDFLNCYTLQMKLSNVFVIDDNEIDLLISEKIIEHVSPDIRLHHYLDAKAALSALNELLVKDKANFPQLIFLDLFMPEMDGWQFLDSYQRLVKDKQVNCLIYIKTNSDDIDHWVQARDNQLVENLLTKPFSHKEYVYILKKHFT